jgi:hypothetical protein
VDRQTREGPRISLALSAEPLAKLPLFKQRKNLIQQDAENCQQKNPYRPGNQCEASVKVEGVGYQAKRPKLAGSGLRLRRLLTDGIGASSSQKVP